MQRSVLQASRARGVVVWAWVFASLAGCVSTPPDDGFDADFHVRGRIGMRDGERSLAADFDWRQAGERFAIQMWGPFGQGRTTVRGNGGIVSIADSRGSIVEGADAGRLMQQAFGWSLPLRAVQRWIAGRFDPRIEASGIRFDNGALAAFEQHGWRVELSAWQETADGAMPGRVVATQGERRVTIVCKEWLHD